MAKSTRSVDTRKGTVDTRREVSKPYAEFPLFPHQSGRWAKKIRGRVHYFGRWGRKDGSCIVPVDDVEASAADAKVEFDRQWPYLSQGKSVPDTKDRAGCTIKELCNRFMEAKQNRLNRKALSPHSFSEYMRTCETLFNFFGRDRLVEDLMPDDFERLQNEMARGCNVVTLKSKINRARCVFKWALDSKLIKSPVEYGQSFDRPEPKLLRAARHEAGPRLFPRDDLVKIIAALEADPIMRSMLLLALNGGFGNHDVASLPQSAVNLKTGWIMFPRPKTAIMRRVPLWPETVKAIQDAVAIRPKPKDPADADLCFLTERGTRFVRMQPSKTSEGRHVTINGLSRRFENLLAELGVPRRRGLNFYTLRHVFETVAGESKDQVAVDAIMGHVDETMAGEYREKISDERLRSVVDTVHAWLWPKKSKPVRKGKGAK